MIGVQHSAFAPERSVWPGLLWAAATGGAQAASLAWPTSGQPQWGLQLLSMMVLAALLLHAPGWKQAALRGWVFATAWLVGTFWWLFVSMHTYGGLAAPLSAAAVLALALFLASYYGLASALFCALAPVHRARSAIVFGALWCLAEIARGSLLTGFPWGAGGYAHVEGPLSPFARWVGVYGISAMAAALAMLLVQCRVADLRRWRSWALALALVGLGGWVALDRHCAVTLCHTPQTQAEPPLTLALLQGNIPQDEKFQEGTGVPQALAWYGQTLKEADARLIVAPETAIPLLPQQLMPGYLESIQARYALGDRAVLLGIPLGSEATGYTNSVWGMHPGLAQPYLYDKHHLVPFGEFIPPLFKWFTAMMNIPLGDFRRGGLDQPSMEWAGQRIAPNICYEDLFGEELGARFRDPSTAPTILVNFSNIGWFGNTLAIDQHLHISRMRTLELERPMVRATNTGATAIIDHRGVVQAQLERHTRGVLQGEVRGRGTATSGGEGVTPFAWWVSRWGLWPLAGLCTLLALLPLAGGRRRARRWFD